MARALWSYDAGARLSWLEAQHWEIDDLLDIVDMLPAPETLPRAARLKFNGPIKAYWKSRLKDLAVPAEMTGLFEGERDALVERINSSLRDCGPALVEQIRARFACLPDTNAAMDELRLKLPPPRPSDPDPQWGAEKWLRWAANSYIPYRYWMIENGQEDAALEHISLKYEDWLYQAYPKLLDQPDCLVYKVHREVVALLERGETVLWTVVDNLPYFQVEMLVGQLEARHLSVERAERRLSMLPSETGVSRRAALTGWLPDESMPEKMEAEAAEGLEPVDSEAGGGPQDPQRPGRHIAPRCPALHLHPRRARPARALARFEGHQPHSAGRGGPRTTDDGGGQGDGPPIGAGSHEPGGHVGPRLDVVRPEWADAACSAIGPSGRRLPEA